MHDNASEAMARLRDRILDVQVAEERDDISLPSNGVDSVLCTVAATSGTSSVGVFYTLQPQLLLGAETDGSAGSTTSSTSAAAIQGYNCGAVRPSNGTQVVATFCAYRWVFQYDG